MRVNAVSANGYTVYDVSRLSRVELPDHWGTFESKTIWGTPWIIGIPQDVLGIAGVPAAGYHPFFAPRRLPHWPSVPVYATEAEARADRLYADPMYAELVPFPLGGFVWYQTGRHWNELEKRAIAERAMAAFRAAWEGADVIR